MGKRTGTIFPPKLPRLELTSKPIPVPDRMAVKTNPWAVGIATTVNVSILLVMLFFVGKKVVETVKPTLLASTNVEVSEYEGPPAADKAGGGGGGGDRSQIEANKGKLPERTAQPLAPPQPQTYEHPKLPEPAAINVQKNLQLPDNPNMPMIGLKSSSNVTLASAGTDRAPAWAPAPAADWVPDTATAMAPATAATLAADFTGSAAASPNQW